MDDTVHSRLRTERTRLKLGRPEVADEVGVSSKTVQRWEADVPIPADKLWLLAPLGFNIYYVLTGHRPPESDPPIFEWKLARLAQASADLQAAVRQVGRSPCETALSRALDLVYRYGIDADGAELLVRLLVDAEESGVREARMVAEEAPPAPRKRRRK